MEPLNIPKDVTTWFRKIFLECNERISNKLSNNPNLAEESLDHTWIEHLSQYSSPLCEQCSESFSQIRPSESENSEKTLFRFGDSASCLLFDNRPQPHSTSDDESTVLPQLIALNRVESCWSALKKIYFAVEKSANFAQPTAMRRISENV